MNAGYFSCRPPCSRAGIGIERGELVDRVVAQDRLDLLETRHTTIGPHGLRHSQPINAAARSSDRIPSRCATASIGPVSSNTDARTKRSRTAAARPARRQVRPDAARHRSHPIPTPAHSEAVPHPRTPDVWRDCRRSPRCDDDNMITVRIVNRHGSGGEVGSLMVSECTVRRRVRGGARRHHPAAPRPLLRHRLNRCR